MSEQRKKILRSAELIKKCFSGNFKPSTALITEDSFDILNGFSVKGEVEFDKVFPVNENSPKPKGKVLFAKCGSKDIIVFKGRMHYYDGFHMREIGHTVYTLKNLGIKKILSVDEAAILNPRFNCGDLAIVYDHVNLTGDNPLIGKNDNELGIRFPDMSNAYDKDLYSVIYRIFQKKMMKINESVYLGISGPQTETEAESRFYRDIGADILGYSLVPENITSVHAGIKFAGIALLTRELIADKMTEDERSENQLIKDQSINRKKASGKLGKVIKEILANF